MTKIERLERLLFLKGQAIALLVAENRQLRERLAFFEEDGVNYEQYESGFEVLENEFLDHTN